MREHLDLANFVSSVSLVLGFAALLVVIDQVALATALVAVAAVLDGLDGGLARRRGGDRTFGAQLDSLTDLACFCVVPAYGLHQAAQQEVRWAGAVVAGGFLVAGAWRLSRFALERKEGHFRGLPTPIAGVLVMLLLLWGAVVPALLGAAALSVLMASNVRVPTVPFAAAHVRGRRNGHRDER